MKHIIRIFWVLTFSLALLTCFTAFAQNSVTETTVGFAWAGNTVNTAVFRKNSVVTFKDTQYTAFYSEDGALTLAKRAVGDSVWTVQKTNYKGNVKDAHNIISIMADGDGYLHVAWDHHNNALKYARSVKPGSLQLGGLLPMIGKNENKLSYPEFYKLNDKQLLFFYRDGGSGSGNMVVNSYNVATQKWTRLHDNLIDGEGERNAYWQACIDDDGVIHVSWVWRESPDVASNHDMAYARSKDGGLTWENSAGEKYTLPINAKTAEYAARIPQKHELINQASMSCDEAGNPFIATYWRSDASAIPQYHIIYRLKGKWYNKSLAFRKTAFSLSGSGTKQIPISRPQILVKGKGEKAAFMLIFRDEERGNKASVYQAKLHRLKRATVSDLNAESLGSWEPTFDTELWKTRKIMNLFIQNTPQKDGEGLTQTPPQLVKILEWKP
ncbi:BNR repeat-containing protein [Pelobium manganitolerans]|uniref:BNR repeat-containing protein n=1 Tax=Pelobium manganitolerans TaxID=1842495 RepID=UPI003FA3921A